MNNLLALPAVFQTIFGIVIAILVLLLTITVHEFGHYIVGKILKFKINEFAIGMGPAIFKKKLKNGEIFSIRIFPLGGFCAFEGEDDAGTPGANKKDYEQQEPVFEDMPAPEGQAQTEGKTVENKTELSPNAFDNKKPWQRILVLIAGGITNIIFAILVVAISFSIYGHFCLTPGSIIPSEEGSIEQGYSLQAGDKLIEIDGHYLYLTSDFSAALKGKKKGDIVNVVVERDGKIIETEVALRCDVTDVSLTDYFDGFDALGVATTLIFNTKEGSVFPNGAYLIGMADGDTLSERIYSVSEFYRELSEYNSGDSVSFVMMIGDKEEIRTVIIPEGFETVKISKDDEITNDKSAAFKKFFKIDSFYIQYDIASSEAKLGFFEGLLRAPAYGFKTTIVSLQSLFALVTGEVGIDQVSGPIGTISMTSQVVTLGFNYVLEMLAMIGISIGVFNLLPIPALDGGRVVFVVIEWIRGKPIKKNVESIIHFVGLIALLAFAIIVDLIKIL